MSNKSLATGHNSDIEPLRRFARSPNTNSTFPNEYPEGTSEHPPFNLCMDPEETKITEKHTDKLNYYYTSCYEEALIKLGTNIAGFVVKKGEDNIYDAENSTECDNDKRERYHAYMNILSLAQRI
ncbi:hypothetical protein YYC_04105 [Plasmodium yoelii 17X]|uniref:Uncharacterized protein n=2 Tax=Plasmodium yoelii TaxID=5861 RepID=Q7R8Y9_PLAYO|nr:hypothetical protein [Plasmodium yoelii yoelii]ETB58516.1 hypothetical protein YYC_04105 [Plasmodium yoelii 17X]